MKYKTTKKVILLSLKEQFFEQILNKTKEYEFRKQFPNESLTAVVYLSFPVMKEHPLISPHNSASLIKYYSGRETGYAIPVLDVYRLEKAISLAEIRNKQPGFQPPQSYSYLKYGSYLFDELIEI